MTDLSTTALLIHSKLCAAAEPSAEWKWKQVEALGRRAALYNGPPAAQRVDTPQCLFGVNHDDPAAQRLQRIYHSTALFGLTTN
jgi:hypothetical protein